MVMVLGWRWYWGGIGMEMVFGWGWYSMGMVFDGDGIVWDCH